ncbi:MAG: AI-2E family transporter [Fibrobacter sp.]|nr:AI-2E family transporter [Fibrobacter sp.]
MAQRKKHDRPKKTGKKESSDSPTISEQGKLTQRLKAIQKTNLEPNTIALNRKTLLILLGMLGITLFFIVKMFIVPVILALCFTTLFYPMYSFFLRITRNNKPISSILCCLALFFGLLIPTYLLIQMIAKELIQFYGTAEPVIKDLIHKGDESSFAKLLEHPMLASLHTIEIDWQSLLFSALKTVGGYGTTLLNKTSTEVLTLILTFAIMFFTMFYLFLDGEKLLRRLQYLSPLRHEYDELLFKRFLMISRATIRGTIVIGLAQGLLGGLTFLAVGIKSWLLWGFVMVMFSLIPFTGAWMVMLPAALLQVVYGHYGKAFIVAIMCILVVSTVDNILRPRLVGNEAKMHDLIVLFSTLGGIAVYGIMGFIVGPVIAALFMTVLDMYGIEYETELNKYESQQTF